MHWVLEGQPTSVFFAEHFLVYLVRVEGHCRLFCDKYFITF